MADQSTSKEPLTREELETILKRQLGENVTVESYTWTYATQPGENYGSTLLALEIRVQPNEVIHTMAKMAPPSEFLQGLFDIQNTFCKEMNLYKLGGPAFIKLQVDGGIENEDIVDVLPKFYGARTSLAGDQDEHADTNAVLLLENLKVSGYKLGSRLTGLDLAHCELAVSRLAQFQAFPVALKQKDPKLYEQVIPKITAKFKTVGGSEDPKEFFKDILDTLESDIPEAAPYSDRIQKNITKYGESLTSTVIKEPFATIVHNDFWTNNMMFSYNDPHDKSLPTGIKFLDFQGTLHNSPVKDLVFFIFSSASTSVKEQYADHLIELYYENFVSTLKKLGCDITAFSFEKFLQEVDEFAPTEFLHVLFMINVIYADKKSAKKDLSEVDGLFSVFNKRSDLMKLKTWETIQLFDQRKWI